LKKTQEEEKKKGKKTTKGILYQFPRDKRKDIDKGKSLPKRKKRKVVKDSNIQALTEDDLENIGDQVKEVKVDAFQHATQQ
jgi:hypothetical protein